MTEGRQSESLTAGADAFNSPAELWARGAEAYLAAQQKFFSDMTEQMGSAGNKAALATSDAYKTEAERLSVSSRSFFDLSTSAAKLSAPPAASKEGPDGNRIACVILTRIFDPSLWISAAGGMDQGLAHLSESPRLADLFDVERRFLAVFRGWLAVRRRTYEYNGLMLQAWMRATQRFSKELNLRADNGEKLESWRDVLTIWVETANSELLETQRTDGYLAAQRQLVSASTELRLAQQEIAEFYSEVFAVPTRTELDDVHKGLTELRREVRTLRRAAHEPPRAKRARVGR
jgi:hypothetical protein